MMFSKINFNCFDVQASSYLADAPNLHKKKTPTNDVQNIEPQEQKSTKKQSFLDLIKYILDPIRAVFQEILHFFQRLWNKDEPKQQSVQTDAVEKKYNDSHLAVLNERDSRPNEKIAYIDEPTSIENDVTEKQDENIPFKKLIFTSFDEKKEQKKIYLLNKLPLSFYKQFINENTSKVTLYDDDYVQQYKSKSRFQDWEGNIASKKAWLQARFPNWIPEDDEPVCMVGHGARGKVLFGLTEHNEFVAIKKQPTKDFKKTEFENQALCPKSPELIGLSESSYHSYVAMQLHMDKYLLTDFVKQYEENSITFLLDILKEVLVTIDMMHQKGISHNDLSSENMLFSYVNNRINVLLIDFGDSHKGDVTPDQKYYDRIHISSSIIRYILLSLKNGMSRDEKQEAMRDYISLNMQEEWQKLIEEVLLNEVKRFPDDIK